MMRGKYWKLFLFLFKFLFEVLFLFLLLGRGGRNCSKKIIKMLYFSSGGREGFSKERTNRRKLSERAFVKAFFFKTSDHLSLQEERLFLIRAVNRGESREVITS